MTHWMCTFAFDRETVVVFDYETLEDSMDEAVKMAIDKIQAEEQHQASELVGFSVLRTSQ